LGFVVLNEVKDPLSIPTKGASVTGAPFLLRRTPACEAGSRSLSQKKNSECERNTRTFYESIVVYFYQMI
jgi:hypothetical protein